MKNIKTWIMGSIFVSFLPLIACAHSFEIGSLHIGHPYARAMVPSASVGGGYLTISNTGSQDDKLVDIISERARSVQLHEMKVENNVMTMREITGGVSVPAGQTIAMKSGGNHIMFMDVARPFQKGETIKAILHFEKAGSVEVDFVVGDMTGSDGETSPQKHHGADH